MKFEVHLPFWLARTICFWVRMRDEWYNAKCDVIEARKEK